MIVVIDDDEHHLDCKIHADNLRFARHIRDNRLDMLNHAVTLIETNIVSWNEHEKNSESTTIVLKRLMCILFSPSSNESSLNYLEASMDRGHCGHGMSWSCWC